MTMDLAPPPTRFPTPSNCTRILLAHLLDRAAIERNLASQTDHHATACPSEPLGDAPPLVHRL
jgi:hypothetical protein